jgi:hypothetical protein
VGELDYAVAKELPDGVRVETGLSWPPAWRGVPGGLRSARLRAVGPVCAPRDIATVGAVRSTRLVQSPRWEYAKGSVLGFDIFSRRERGFFYAFMVGGVEGGARSFRGEKFDEGHHPQSADPAVRFAELPICDGVLRVQGGLYSPAEPFLPQPPALVRDDLAERAAGALLHELGDGVGLDAVVSTGEELVDAAERDGVVLLFMVGCGVEVEQQTGGLIGDHWDRGLFLVFGWFNGFEPDDRCSSDREGRRPDGGEPKQRRGFDVLVGLGHDFLPL